MPPSLWPTTAMRFESTSLRSDEELHGGAHVVGVIGERRRFVAAAAHAHAALVVAEHDEPRVGDDVSELTEDRDAEGQLVAIRRAASADEQHGRQSHRGRLGGFRQRARQHKPVARDPDLLVVRPRDGHTPGRHRRDVLAYDFEPLRPGC